MAVRLSAWSNSLPLDGCSWKNILEYFPKKCRENSSFIKIWQRERVLDMKTYVHFWYTAQFFSEWKMLQTQLVDKFKHIFTAFFFLKLCRYGKMWKSIIESGRTQSSIWRMRFACRINKATNTNSEYVMILLFRCNNICTNEPQC